MTTPTSINGATSPAARATIPPLESILVPQTTTNSCVRPARSGALTKALATSAISSKLSIIDKKADNISNIVVAINKIAEQTNLLSLNAAVEAEKAGEYGRGFSVVAREIRRLSDQTEISTSRIAKVVEEMQSAVSSGVMEMDKFVMRVNQSVGEMGGISARLVKIIEQVGDLFPRYEEVNEAMQAQSSGAIEISKAMGQLSEISGQTRESLQEFHKAAMHLTNAVEELQAEISQFKVSH